MSTVEQIEAAVARLDPADRVELLRRLTARDDAWAEGEVDADGNDAWDRQMIADAKAGKFDKLIAEARAEEAAGLTRDLP